MNTRLRILLATVIVFAAIGVVTGIARATIPAMELVPYVPVFYVDDLDTEHFWQIVSNEPDGDDCSYVVVRRNRSRQFEEITGYVLANASYASESNPPLWDAIPARTCIFGTVYIEAGWNKHLLYFNNQPLINCCADTDPD